MGLNSTWIEASKRRRCRTIRITRGSIIRRWFILKDTEMRSLSDVQEVSYCGWCSSGIGVSSSSHQVRMKHRMKIRIEKRRCVQASQATIQRIILVRTCLRERGRWTIRTVLTWTLTGSTTTGESRSSIPSTSMSSSGSCFLIVEAEKTFTSSFPSSILMFVIVSSLLLSVIDRCLLCVELVEIDDGELNGEDEHFFFVGVWKLEKSTVAVEDAM